MDAASAAGCHWQGRSDVCLQIENVIVLPLGLLPTDNFGLSPANRTGKKRAVTGPHPDLQAIFRTSDINPGDTPVRG